VFYVLNCLLLEKLENDDAIHHDFDDMYFNGADT